METELYKALTKRLSQASKVAADFYSYIDGVNLSSSQPENFTETELELLKDWGSSYLASELNHIGAEESSVDVDFHLTDGELQADLNINCSDELTDSSSTSKLVTDFVTDPIKAIIMKTLDISEVDEHDVKFEFLLIDEYKKDSSLSFDIFQTFYDGTQLNFSPADLKTVQSEILSTLNYWGYGFWGDTNSSVKTFIQVLSDDETISSSHSFTHTLEIENPFEE